MARQIIGHRFLDLNKQGEVILVEEKDRDFSSWTLRDVKGFYQKTSFPFYQLLIHSDSKNDYYLDYHWLQERLTGQGRFTSGVKSIHRNELPTTTYG